MCLRYMAEERNALFSLTQGYYWNLLLYRYDGKDRHSIDPSSQSFSTTPGPACVRGGTISVRKRVFNQVRGDVPNPKCLPKPYPLVEI